MTMVKNDKNNIWKYVRSDVDVDDLIFNYDAYRIREQEDGRSDR